MTLTVVLYLEAALLVGKTHHVLVFAYQDTPAYVAPDPRSTHSFATWVTVTDGRITETFTISWSASRGVRLLQLPQPGRNLSLTESLQQAASQGLYVTRWGPFRVSEAGYLRAKAAFHRLEAAERDGSIRYKALDRGTRFRRRPAINCIHALTDVAGLGIRTWDQSGVSASETVIRAYAANGVILGNDESASWVWDSLRGDFEATYAQSPVRLPDLGASGVVHRSGPLLHNASRDRTNN